MHSPYNNINVIQHNFKLQLNQNKKYDWAAKDIFIARYFKFGEVFSHHIALLACISFGNRFTRRQQGFPSGQSQQ
jgi:hypothetical protein